MIQKVSMTTILVTFVTLISCSHQDKKLSYDSKSNKRAWQITKTNIELRVLENKRLQTIKDLTLIEKSIMKLKLGKARSDFKNRNS